MFILFSRTFDKINFRCTFILHFYLPYVLETNLRPSLFIIIPIVTLLTLLKLYHIHNLYHRIVTIWKTCTINIKPIHPLPELRILCVRLIKSPLNSIDVVWEFTKSFFMSVWAHTSVSCLHHITIVDQLDPFSVYSQVTLKER